MSKILDFDALEAFMKTAYEQATPLQIHSGNSKSLLGNPLFDHKGATALDMSQFQGIIDYMPTELTLRAGAATTMQEINKALTKNQQMLAFEPPDFSKILKVKHGKAATLIGSLMTNFSGSRRPLAGAARDHFLAFRAVSGRGEPFKYGAAVVKNVTGYDLCKIMAGSFGTLSALYEVTVKTLPMASSSKSLLLRVREVSDLSALLSEGFRTPFSLSGVSLLPANQGEQAIWRTEKQIEELTQNKDMPLIAMRLEGLKAAVDGRIDSLRAHLLNKFESLTPDDFTILDHNSVPFWQAMTNVTPFLHGKDTDQIWRISLPCAACIDLIEALKSLNIKDYYADWGGALLWLLLPNQAETTANIANAKAVRRIAETYKAHAMLFRGDAALKREIGAFHPMPKPLAELNQRLKIAFDPKEILNPNRLFI